MAAVKKNKSNKPPRIGIVASSFNDFITKRLLQACLLELKLAGVNQVTTVWVPGAFEAPLAALALARRKDIDGVICLGAVLRGETYHFDVVANEAGRGIMEVSLRTGKPVMMGILTADTGSQAEGRSKPKGGSNKGRDCARAVLEMIALLKNL